MTPDYETGYREGESNRQADWSFALTELCELPEGVDHEDPASVARYIDGLARSVRTYHDAGIVAGTVTAEEIIAIFDKAQARQRPHHLRMQ